MYINRGYEIYYYRSRRSIVLLRPFTQVFTIQDQGQCPKMIGTLFILSNYKPYISNRTRPAFLDCSDIKMHRIIWLLTIQV